MTVKESTVCSLIQSFPVFLILAQNAQKCLKTPLVYKPPSPTHSPEYYEALDTLFQSVYSHSPHGSNSGHSGVYGGTHGVYGGAHGVTDYSYHYPDTSSSNCQYSYGKKWGGNSKPCYQYVYTTGNGYHTYGSGLQGYSSYGLKKGNIYALNNVTTASYAPGQVYNTKNKYQVIVKKTKIGKKRSRKSGGKYNHY